MELFTRDMVLMGPPAATRAWAISIAEKFGEITDHEVEVWMSVVGGQLGHITWSAQIDGTAELVAMSQMALADQSYLALIEEGRPFFTEPARDTLHRPFTQLPPGRSRPGNAAIVTTATARSGSLGDAVGWGIEAAEHVSAVSGLPTAMFGTSGGGFSDLTWIGWAIDLTTLDAANRAINEDDGYRKLIARGGGLFADGSGRQEIFIRIA